MEERGASVNEDGVTRQEIPERIIGGLEEGDSYEYRKEFIAIVEEKFEEN